MVDKQKTTPSGYACHPSTGGELLGADTTGLLKKYRHCTNSTACAIKFMKMVEAE